MNIKQSIKKFFDTLRPMTPYQRAEHIWYHYKPNILFGLVIAFVVVGFLCTLLMPKKQTLLSGVSVNADMTADGCDYLTDLLLEQLGGDPDKQQVELNMSFFEQMNSTGELDRNYSRAMSLMAQINQRTLDYMVMDRAALDYYATQDVFTDLQQLLPEDMLDQFTLIHAREEDETQEHPIAIDITQLPFVQACVENNNGVYIAFPGNTDRDFTPENIMQYLMNWS